MTFIERSYPSALKSLLRIGEICPLDFRRLNFVHLYNELREFDSCWNQYNPYKPSIARMGLSVTSLDGGLSGRPDLYSLREFYRQEGALYKESDFKVPTLVYKKCSEAHPVLDHFRSYLGRSHFLRLGQGGFFPPHRDGAGGEDVDTFRVLVPLRGTRSDNFVFLFENQRVHLEPGQAYYINTLRKHALYAFNSPADLLILNVAIAHESLDLLLKRLI